MTSILPQDPDSNTSHSPEPCTRGCDETCAAPLSPDEREHLVYVDQNGEPDECVEDCPGCHWEGNPDCESLRSGCATCDPDDVWVAS